MAEDRQQTAKGPKGIRNRLKKAFGLGSRSTPQSHSNSPSTPVAPPFVTAPPSILSPSPVAVPLPASLTPPAASSPPVTQLPVVPPAPAGSPTPAVTIDPEEAAKLRAKYTCFRILVIGRANAGKTTLLKRVCNTTEEPSIYDEDKNLVSYQPIVISHTHRFFINSSNRPQRCRLDDFCTYL